MLQNPRKMTQNLELNWSNSLKRQRKELQLLHGHFARIRILFGDRNHTLNAYKVCMFLLWQCTLFHVQKVNTCCKRSIYQEIMAQPWQCCLNLNIQNGVHYWYNPILVVALTWLLRVAHQSEIGNAIAKHDCKFKPSQMHCSLLDIIKYFGEFISVFLKSTNHSLSSKECMPSKLLFLFKQAA